MQGSFTLLKIISRLLLPFMILFGMYIILNGDLSPGGGFQGGVVLASVCILLYFIDETNRLNTGSILMIEKILFIMLLAVALLSQASAMNNFQLCCLISLNAIIGMKVTLGIGAIMIMFLEEGNL